MWAGHRFFFVLPRLLYSTKNNQSTRNLSPYPPTHTHTPPNIHPPTHPRPTCLAYPQVTFSLNLSSAQSLGTKEPSTFLSSSRRLPQRLVALVALRLQRRPLLTASS